MAAIKKKVSLKNVTDLSLPHLNDCSLCFLLEKIKDASNRTAGDSTITEGSKTEIMNASLLSSLVCTVPREICQELSMQTLFFWDL